MAGLADPVVVQPQHVFAVVNRVLNIKGFRAAVGKMAGTADNTGAFVGFAGLRRYEL